MKDITLSFSDMKDLTLTYLDEDDEKINIFNTQSLIEAYKFANKENLKTLKINISSN